VTHRVNVSCTRADGTAVRIHPHNGKQLKGEASGREEGGPSASWLAAASELASDAACELASAHKLRSACRLRDLLRHGGSSAVELMLCYGLSPRTEQLQSVIVTQKPAVLCDTLVTHSQQGWCRSRGKSLRSTDQLLNGRLTSATAESNTVLSKRAPANVLLAVLEAHPSVPRCVFFTRA